MMEPPWWPLTRCCRLPGAVPGTEGDRRPRDPQLMAMTWRGRGLSGRRARKVLNQNIPTTKEN